MKNKLLLLGMGLLMLVFILSFVSNLKIYNSTQKLNLGLDGGVNNFFGGLIVNCVEIVFIFIGVLYFSRGVKDTRPQELTPVED